MAEAPFSCENCAREIPVKPLWTALSKRARLYCSGCKHQVTHDHLMKRAEAHEPAKVLILAYGQLEHFGWVSYGALVNAGIEANPQLVGGLLTGLARAGLIRRGSSSKSVLSDLVNPHPIFVPGPNYPRREAQKINR